MKLCLIGSTRFMPQYVEANRALTLKGHIVYTVAAISTSAQGTDITEEEKIVLDLVHLRKILESDAVVVITDESGYMGFSTKRELQWAQMLEKPIFYSPNDVTSAFYSRFGIGDFRG